MGGGALLRSQFGGRIRFNVAEKLLHSRYRFFFHDTHMIVDGNVQSFENGYNLLAAHIQ
jgi:hypothetical protein